VKYMEPLTCNWYITRDAEFRTFYVLIYRISTFNEPLSCSVLISCNRGINVETGINHLNTNRDVKTPLKFSASGYLILHMPILITLNGNNAHFISNAVQTNILNISCCENAHVRSSRNFSRCFSWRVSLPLIAAICEPLPTGIASVLSAHTFH
jgi:hypothetical protein